MKTNPVPNTQFALRLQAAMDQVNMSLHEAALKFNVSYEYMRRLTRGDNNPSKPLLKLLSLEFNWDFDDMDRMIVEDRFPSIASVGSLPQAAADSAKVILERARGGAS